MNYYFLGIGGIGMSALARFFHRRGDTVSGYDRTPSPLTDELRAEGIETGPYDPSLEYDFDQMCTNVGSEYWRDVLRTEIAAWKAGQPNADPRFWADGLPPRGPRMLLTAIHKWQQPEINEIVVYTEYTLRSTKSGVELMHVWVRGDKMQPVDVKGDPVELSTDQAFIDRSGMGSKLAHRCILLEQMSDFALRNLPTSISRWHFQHDRYISSNPVFYSFTINPDGSIERSDYSEDAFGNECFTD